MQYPAFALFHECSGFCLSEYLECKVMYCVNHCTALLLGEWMNVDEAIDNFLKTERP